MTTRAHDRRNLAVHRAYTAPDTQSSHSPTTAEASKGASDSLPMMMCTFFLPWHSALISPLSIQDIDEHCRPYPNAALAASVHFQQARPRWTGLIHVSLSNSPINRYPRHSLCGSFSPPWVRRRSGQTIGFICFEILHARSRATAISCSQLAKR